jgi:hypothetical protein
MLMQKDSYINITKAPLVESVQENEELPRMVKLRKYTRPPESDNAIPYDHNRAVLEDFIYAQELAAWMKIMEPYLEADREAIMEDIARDALEDEK